MNLRVALTTRNPFYRLWTNIFSSKTLCYEVS